MRLRVLIHGASGRLGARAVAIVAAASEEFELVGTPSRDVAPSEWPAADIVFDASIKSASERVVEWAVSTGASAVIGTSGWGDGEVARLPKDARLRIVPNFSVGSVLATALASKAARFFDQIEIVETHHSKKVDAPSGTAVRTAERIAAARGETVAGIPIHSLRLDGMGAQQTVTFGGAGESLTIGHLVTDPAAYDAGILLALRAAPQLTSPTIGLDDLLGLNARPEGGRA